MQKEQEKIRETYLWGKVYELLYQLEAVPDEAVQMWRRWFVLLWEEYQDEAYDGIRIRYMVALWYRVEETRKPWREWLQQYKCSYNTGYGYEELGGRDGKWYCLERRQVIEKERASVAWESIPPTLSRRSGISFRGAPVAQGPIK